MRSKPYVLILLTTIALGLSVIGGFNAWVDPLELISSSAVHGLDPKQTPRQHVCSDIKARGRLPPAAPRLLF